MKSRAFKGKTKIGAHSSLRKLARAMRQGRVPPERQVIIDNAMRMAIVRKRAYYNSSPGKRMYRSMHT